jgi:hypothetical protein
VSSLMGSIVVRDYEQLPVVLDEELAFGGSRSKVSDFNVDSARLEAATILSDWKAGILLDERAGQMVGL